jgi:hypothetical protein
LATDWLRLTGQTGATPPFMANGRILPRMGARGMILAAGMVLSP